MVTLTPGNCPLLFFEKLMRFKTKVIDRTLQSVPFDRAHKIFMDAYNQSMESQKFNAMQVHQNKVAELEQQYSDDNEAPTEVSFSDQVRLQPASTSVATVVGQTALLEEFLNDSLIGPNMQEHFMPQIIKLLASRWDMQKCLNEEGLIDGTLAREVIFKNFASDWDIGLYLVLMLNSRSSWLKTQYKGEARSYCSLVPLIPYAMKLVHSVPYSKWDRETIGKVVNSKLAQAMTADISACDGVPTKDMIFYRNQGLVYKTGPKAGEMRNPESTYRLYNLKDTPLETLPELAQVMLTQIWCAHPNYRTRYMILDPKNWDNIPTPLVESQVFNAVSNKINIAPAQDMPWM